MMGKETIMTTTHDITSFIDEWLADHQGLVNGVSVDFALDVRNMVQHWADLDFPELDIPEPVGV